MGSSGTQDSTELVVAGSGDVYVAPYGTTLPTAENSSLNAAFVKCGYTTEDGLTLTWTPTVSEFMSWQSRTAVRRELTGSEYAFKFVLEQWNANNLSVAFGGGSVRVVSAGHYAFDFLKDTDALQERSCVADWNDGSKHFRLVLPRVNVTDSAEIQLTRGSLAVLPISFKALAPATGASAILYTDDEDFWS